MIENNKDFEEKISEIIRKQTKASPGMINVKELNERLFLNNLFHNFNIECDGSNSVRENRMKIQKLLQNNLRESIGMFHSKELNETTFIIELLSKFKLTEKIDERAN